ncbi:MAG: hypothetical protein HXS44_15285 [Theionarchaea archaeon]|nr:hypothetical protein [Theionarchaea archaeon]
MLTKLTVPQRKDIVKGLLLLLLCLTALCIGQDPCENVTCSTICRGEDLWEQKCTNGECVGHQIIEHDSRECGYNPCRDIVCKNECFGTELWKMKCSEGECIQDSLIETQSGECGYTVISGDITEEEYQVYKAYIEGRFSEETIVILDNTFWGTYGVYAYGRTQFGVSLSEEMPKLEKETYDDFESRNEASFPLGDFFNVSMQIVLLNDEEMLNIFEEGEGWDDFYDMYPSAQGIMNLSRVGFNADMTQAFLYAGNQTHWLSGAGYYVLLVKKDDVWIVEQEAMIWIS